MELEKQVRNLYKINYIGFLIVVIMFVGGFYDAFMKFSKYGFTYEMEIIISDISGEHHIVSEKDIIIDVFIVGLFMFLTLISLYNCAGWQYLSNYTLKLSERVEKDEEES